MYHMHGNVRIAPDVGRGDEAPDKLVFKDGQYFDFFNSPTGMFTYTFLSLLREHSVLFVGLSMQDDNIRRLLHYSTQERMRAYIDEKTVEDRSEARIKAIRSEARIKAIRHWAIIPWCKERAKERELNAKMLRDLGTQVLWWVRDKQDIAMRLGQVYEAVDDRSWGDVYTVPDAPEARPRPSS
jgi:hypothetical protein